MALQECKSTHKFGPFIKDNNNEVHRVCLCCKKVSYYPASLEINNEIKRWEDANNIFGYIVNQDLVSNCTGDDFIRLIDLVFNDLSYLDINENAKNKFVNKIIHCNNHFNIDNIDRFNLVEEFLEYFNLFFKKEELEIKYGIGSFSEDNYIEFDSVGLSINNRLNKELELLYDLREEKESSIKR